MTRRTWTKEDDDTLRKLYEDPERAIPEIAATMGISPAYVRVRASRIGAGRPASPTRQGKPPRRPREPESDIARRRAVLLGLEPRPVASRRVIPDEDLLRYGGEGIAPEGVEAALPWDTIASCIERVP